MSNLDIGSLLLINGVTSVPSRLIIAKFGNLRVFNYCMSCVVKLAESRCGFIFDVVVQFFRRIIVINLNIIFVT